jgi:methylated-DNA-[protein]-cysteine S-methyltransferase
MHRSLLLIAKIPKGKVTTYKALAVVTNSSPRAIGQVMRNNKHPEKYPCYKVIKSSGEIGGYDGRLKGIKVERKMQLLRRDGIEIKKNRIDLQRYLHRFT